MGNIRVIGPRNSGKTTYLAGLAYWQRNSTTAKNRQFEVIPLNEETEQLANKAADLIVQGSQFEQSRFKSTFDLSSYSFRVKVKPRFKQKRTFDLVVKDYPGEVFEKLDAGTSDPMYEDFIQDCLDGDVEGCLILLTEWGPQQDKLYRRIFAHFVREMDKRDRLKDLRLAVAISKCERGEIWPGRLDPKIDVFDAHLPETLTLLQSQVPKQNLQFFALSTFGVLKPNDPRPNRIEMLGARSSRAVLRETDYNSWKPYGMIDPLYWLNTGNYVEFKS